MEMEVCHIKYAFPALVEIATAVNITAQLDPPKAKE